MLGYTLQVTTSNQLVRAVIGCSDLPQYNLMLKPATVHFYDALQLIGCRPEGHWVILPALEMSSEITCKCKKEKKVSMIVPSYSITLP